jgi:hypothetical protein
MSLGMQPRVASFRADISRACKFGRLDYIIVLYTEVSRAKVAFERYFPSMPQMAQLWSDLQAPT